MKKIVLIFAAIILTASAVVAQTTEFNYQGSLRDGANPANGNYDLEFRLYDALAAGTQIGPLVTRTGVAVASGAFNVQLDFGASFPGADRYLEIRVKPSGPGLYTILTPRQKINSTPHAVRSLSAENANSLGGVAANQYVVTTGGNLNIAGNGTIGGTLSGGIVNATTQFNLGGVRVLSNEGFLNTFVGINSGVVNTGSVNAFFGTAAGKANTTGGSNAFFGSLAGERNTEGDNNSFFGRGAGNFNTTGSSNSFFGSLSGDSNTVGARNSFFGHLSGSATIGGSDNSFFGYLSGNDNTSGVSNAFFGAGAGAANTIASGNAFFGANSGLANTSGLNNSFFGASSGLANTTAGSNTFIGVSAGRSTTTGSENTFVGTSAGFNNTTGNQNTFLGRNAGRANLTGINNTFAGHETGFSNTGSSNSFFGSLAGNANTSGFNNAFFGSETGAANTTGEVNTFLGTAAGKVNTTGSENTFIGTSAGFSNTIGGTNTFVGRSAGRLNVAGGDNTFVGNDAGFTSGNSFNTFVGARAGRATTGQSNAFFGAGSGELTTSPFGNSFFGTASGATNTTGGGNSFFGLGAGSFNTLGSNNNFFGFHAGYGNTSGNRNNFIGLAAGDTNTTGSSNTVLGDLADVSTGALTFATAIGAGATAANSNSVVLGRSTDTVRIPGGLRVSGDGLVTGTLDVNGNVNFDSRVLILTGNLGQVVLDARGVISGLHPSGAGGSDLCEFGSGQESYPRGAIGNCSSSIRYKENVSNFTRGLDLVRNLRPVTYRWKSSGVNDVGFIAEEVEQAEPLLATYNEEGEIEGVKYKQITTVLVNAVNEQQAQIEALQRQLRKEQSENEAMKAYLCSKDPTALFCRSAETVNK